MSTVIESLNTNELIHRYKTGESTNKLISEFGIGKTTLYRILERNGVSRKNRLYRIIPDADIVNHYLSGESELSLSKRYSIDRNGIRNRLLKAGVQPRNASQAGLLMMSKLSPTERQARSSAAHEAVRGRKVPIAEREQKAKTRERKCLGTSKTEFLFADMLQDKGIINITHQKAVGIYNIDIAIEGPRIAVEIYGGNFHTHFRHARRESERFPYLLDSGWNVLIIWVNGRNHPLTIEAANYIISFIKHLRTNKSKRCEYRVIGGDGEPITTPSLQLNGLPTVISPAHTD